MKIQVQNAQLVVFESALFRTTTSLIIGEEHLLLVDPNWLPLEIDFISNFVNGIKNQKECFLLFTHSDYDHIIGFGAFSDFKTIASQNFIDSPKKTEVLGQIAKFDDENYIQRAYEITYPRIDLPIAADSHGLKLGQDEYLFFQSRGHNHDGLIAYNKSKGILICGDYLSNIEFPYVYDSFKLYEQTLLKLEQVIKEEGVKFLVPGHGDVTQDIPTMENRIFESHTYLRDIKKSVVSKSAFDLKALWKKYDFPKVMTEFHNANLSLLKKELDL